jgi:glucose/arabinose dehydrogenase
MSKRAATIVIFLFLFLIIFATYLSRLVKEAADRHNHVTTFQTTPQPTLTKDSSVLTTLADNLEIPWGLGFLPDGSLLFTERPGRVRMITADGKLQPDPVMTIVGVNATGEGGLLGIAIHPQFANNKFVYLYASYTGDTGRMVNRVTRYTFDGTHLNDERVMIDGIPGSSNHDGGRIKFGPDGYLYITTGDSEAPSLAQDKSSLAGKILRLTGDGKPAPGNPFNSPVYSYGHRNPQGLAWDDQGRLWSTEHGRSAPTGYDELNLIEPGKNYGWPIIQGDEKKDGMVTPVINSGPTTTWAPAGAVFLNGSIFFGGLKGEGLYEVVINGPTVTLKKHFDHQLGRVRDVVLGPDGFFYITTSNRDGRGTPQPNDDKIYRVNPAKL